MPHWTQRRRGSRWPALQTQAVARDWGNSSITKGSKWAGSVSVLVAMVNRGTNGRLMRGRVKRRACVDYFKIGNLDCSVQDLGSADPNTGFRMFCRWWERSFLALSSASASEFEANASECEWAWTLRTSELLFIYGSATHLFLPLGIPPLTELLFPPTPSVMTHFRSFHTSAPESSHWGGWHGNRMVVFVK